jgi:hypothetical protein
MVSGAGEGIRGSMRAEKDGRGRGWRHIENVVIPSTHATEFYADVMDANYRVLDEDHRSIPVAQYREELRRVVTRLLVDQAALDAHLLRLDSDDLGFNRACTEDFAYWVFNTPSNAWSALALFALIRDSDSLLSLSNEIHLHSAAHWQAELNIGRPLFAPGDRDDLAAQRLYALANTLHAAPFETA